MIPCLVFFSFNILIITSPCLSILGTPFSSTTFSISSLNVIAVPQCWEQYLDPLAGVFWQPILSNRFPMPNRLKGTLQWKEIVSFSKRRIIYLPTTTAPGIPGKCNCATSFTMHTWPAFFIFPSQTRVLLHPGLSQTWSVDITIRNFIYIINRCGNPHT